MPIRYPSGAKAGQLYQKPLNQGEVAQPKSTKSITNTNTRQSLARPMVDKRVPSSTSGRGMSLEQEINDTNDLYNATERALIYKKPTPVNIVHVEYPKRSAAVIREAYFQKPSTVDYSGVYRSRALEFEAKETKLKTSFPLDNIHVHQIEHLQKSIQHGAIAFVIVRFTALGKTFWMDAQQIIEVFHEQELGGRKSIPIQTFEQKGHLIPCSFGASIDYLQVIDQIYFS